MKLGRIATAAGISAVLFMALATPASAHDVAVYHGSDVGAVNRHVLVSVLDKECDGNTVFVEYYVSTIGGSVFYNMYDSNGCGNSGSARDHYPQQVTKIRICETGAGCSAWMYT